MGFLVREKESGVMSLSRPVRPLRGSILQPHSKSLFLNENTWKRKEQNIGT